jgi:hypothetical protein
MQEDTDAQHHAALWQLLLTKPPARLELPRQSLVDLLRDIQIQGVLDNSQ